MIYNDPIEATDSNSFYLKLYRQLRDDLRQNMNDMVLLGESADLMGNTEDLDQYNNHLRDVIEKNILRINKVVNKMEGFDES